MATQHQVFPLQQCFQPLRDSSTARKTKQQITKTNRQQARNTWCFIWRITFLDMFALYFLTLLIWVNLLGVSKETTDVGYEFKTLRVFFDRQSHCDGGKKSLHLSMLEILQKKNNPNHWGWAKRQNSSLLLRIFQKFYEWICKKDSVNAFYLETSHF